MDFKTMNELIPYAKGLKEKVLTMSPYPNVILAMPGRHQLDTTPIGGDFVVMVNDKKMGWKRHQFTHTDLFKDVELRRKVARDDELIRAYYSIITGRNSPLDFSFVNHTIAKLIDPQTFLQATQALAVAEHRRYGKHEGRFGGRFLPFRFAAGIDEGLWTAADAASMQNRGRPGVEILEKTYGTPVLTKELMG